MDYSKYRRSGELSDLSVIVDKSTFNLHKFPLFVRSDYFKERCASSSSITLEDFPGSAAIFETIADYLYGKQVDVNGQNAVPIRCAIEYLRMNDDIEKKSQPYQKSLASIAEAVIFDNTHTAKAKRDYDKALNLLDQAIQSAPYAEKSGIHLNLIDSFVDSLAYSSKTAPVYDIYGLPNKSISEDSCLKKSQLEILNSLPLSWMLDLIKSSQKIGLNQDVLASIVKNYLDSNTGVNLPSHESKLSRPTELISIAADILKVERKLNQIENQDDGKKSSNENTSEDSNNQPSTENLSKIMADILKINPTKKNEKKDEEENDDKNENLKNILSDVLKPVNKKRTNQKPANDEEKLKVITSVSRLLKELGLEPPFALPWLLIYLDSLDKLNADDDIKSVFKKWAWNALRDLKDDPVDNELGLVSPSAMIQLANELDKSGPNELNPQNDLKTKKLINFIDNYLDEQANKRELDPETFKNLISAIPKNKRDSFDKPMEILLKLLKKEKIDDKTKDELLKLIDFSKLSEKTLQNCKESELIPPQYIAEAALALCAKLRKEIEEAKLDNKFNDFRVNPQYSNRLVPNSYQPTNYDTSYTPINHTSSPSPRTRSIDPPLSKNDRSYLHNKDNRLNPRNNKTIYPIPMIRNSPEKSNLTLIDNTGTNHVEFSSEFYANDEKDLNNDYFYSSSYSFSTLY